MYTLIAIVIAGILAGILAIRWACKSPERLFECYNHHGKSVWVRTALRGRHRDHCLCFSCKQFLPASDKNCPIAQAVYQACIDHHVVTPVWECHKFREDPID